MPEPSSARLILIVGVDSQTDSVLAMLTTNEIEMATDQDVVMPGSRLGLPFPVVFETDLIGSLWVSQLEPPIGVIPDETLEALLRLRHGLHAPELLPHQGLPVDGTSDPRWRFKLEELRVIQALSAACTAYLVEVSDREAATIDDEEAEQTGDEATAIPALPEPVLARTLGTILSQETTHGPEPSKALADSVGLPAGTVREAVAFLEDRGFVEKDPEAPWSLRINESRSCAIGVSIRPSELIGVVTNLKAANLLPAAERRALKSTDVREVVDAIRALVVDLQRALPDESETVIGLGVELSGHIDGRSGEVVFSPDLRTEHAEFWRAVPLAELLAQATGLDTVVENDANALALYEQWYGDGRHVDDFAVVLIGAKGVGSGLVVGGTLLHGSEGMAGEIGHLVIEPGGAECRCGNQGCLETLVSEEAILRAIGTEGRSIPPDLEAAARLVRKGDRTATAAFRRAGKDLGRGLSMLLNLTNPSQVIVFGQPQLTDDRHGGPAVLFLSALTGSAEADAFLFAGWRYKLISKVIDQELGAEGAAAAVLARMVTRPPNGGGSEEAPPRFLSSGAPAATVPGLDHSLMMGSMPWVYELLSPSLLRGRSSFTQLWAAKRQKEEWRAGNPSAR
jgi:predicted NBD/HSP70 family sugar kinase